MNLFEIALISLALAFNTSGICIAAGLSLRKSDAGAMLSFLFLLVTIQLLFSFTGLLFGKVISGIFPSSTQWIALLLFILIGTKILYEWLQIRTEELSPDFTDMKVVLKMSLAAGIDPFIIFCGIGFLLPGLPETILVAGMTFLLFCSAWIIIGRSGGGASLKMRLIPVGGFILLAAGLHLFLKLIR